ncbi:class I SAM-dependent methyltransferase [Patescibacteria group bacterium]|nr:class I SAM-dependent methyltransferase [Patescibacteria group bacterium]
MKSETFIKYEQSGDYHWKEHQYLFDRIFASKRKDLITAPIKAHKNAIVLEVGCGDGIILAELSKYLPAKNLYGIDTSIKGIELACQHLPEINLSVGDTCSLAFQDSKFDFVIAADVIEHLEHLEKMLAEVRRVLKDKGKLIISTPNRISLGKRLYKLRRGEERKSDSLHIKEFSYTELKDILERFGFTVKSAKSLDIDAFSKNFILKNRLLSNLRLLLGQLFPKMSNLLVFVAER